MQLERINVLRIFLENERQRVNVESFINENDVKYICATRGDGGAIFYLKIFFFVFFLRRNVAIVYPRQKAIAWVMRQSARVFYIEDGLNFIKQSKYLVFICRIGYRSLEFFYPTKVIVESRSL